MRTYKFPQYIKKVSRKTAALLLTVLLCIMSAGTAFAAEGAPLQAAETDAAYEPVALAGNSLLVTGGHETYMSGTGGGLFQPDKVMTRAEAAQVLYNLLKSKPTNFGTAFSDVPAGKWYTTAVNALASLKVISGFSNGTFSPDGGVTRAQFVTLLCKCFGLSGGKSTFVDVPSGHWAENYVAAAADAGWIFGVGNNKFEPDRGIKRGEVTAVLNRALGRVDTEGYAADRDTQKFTDVPKTHSFYLHITEAASPKADSNTSTTGFQVGQTLRVKASSGLNLRDYPATGAVIAALTNGTLLTVIGVSNPDWPQVRTSSGRVGYVSGQYVEIVQNGSGSGSSGSGGSSSDFTAGQTVRITASGGLYFRSAPVDGAVIATLSYHTVLTIVDTNNAGWPQVRTADGRTGYVSANYIEAYEPGTASRVSLSSSSFSLAQYQTFRLDVAVDDGMDSMYWTSSNPDVARVGYSVAYNDTEQGAMVYGVAPGTAKLTISNPDGSAKAVCTVTVTAAEPVRFAYASENAALVGQPFDLVAVTDPGRTSVTFQVVGGQSYTTNSFSTEVRASSHNLPNTSVRVFRRSVTFSTPGTYTVRAMASDSTVAKQFTVFVQASETSRTVTSSADRRTSTDMLNVIANFEGSVWEIRDDDLARKNPTVGYGYVVTKNTAFYNTLTYTELFAMLVNTVNEGGYAGAVNNFRRNNNLRMSQAQFDALVSFTYNLGAGNLSTSYGVFRVVYNAVVPPTDLSESNPYTGTLNVVGTSMYDSPSLTGTVVTDVPNGAQVSVVEVKTNFSSTKHEVWYRVKYGSKTGWVPAGFVSLSGSHTHDMAYIDATALSYNYLQWSTASGSRISGLVWRRLAELKIFVFANYTEAYHSNPNYELNTYYFNFPENCKAYDRH